MTLVVILTVRRKAADSFRAFERQAAAVMARHGGAIERTVVVNSDADLFKEVHIVTFPDAAARAAYRKDPELAALLPLREMSVISTEVLIGEDGPVYRPGA
jgi:hypothetical protein